MGYYYQCGASPYENAFIWTPQRGLDTLPFPPGTVDSRAYDINNVGQVTGFFDRNNDGVAWTAFVFDGQMVVDLGTLPGGNYSEGEAIDNRGEVAGAWGNYTTGPPQAFFQSNGKMLDLGLVLGVYSSRARDLNDKGIVVGWTILRFGAERRGFILEGDSVTLLESLPGAVSATAQAIDNLGRVVGYSIFESAKDGSSRARATLWSSGQTIDLGTVSGRTDSLASDINDLGQVVGHVCNDGFADLAAFIWQNGVMSNLNDLVPAGTGVDIRLADAINANGQIAGSGSMGGHSVGVLLTPRAPLGDLDLDCNVGIKDLLRLLSLWGPCDGCRADLDGDGIVDQDDLSLLLASWV